MDNIFQDLISLTKAYIQQEYSSHSKIFSELAFNTPSKPSPPMHSLNVKNSSLPIQNKIPEPVTNSKKDNTPASKPLKEKKEEVRKEYAALRQLLQKVVPAFPICDLPNEETLYFVVNDPLNSAQNELAQNIAKGTQIRYPHYKIQLLNTPPPEGSKAVYLHQNELEKCLVEPVYKNVLWKNIRTILETK